MNTRRTCTLIACAITALVACSCAFLSKGDQGAARFFTIEQTPSASEAVTAPTTPKQSVDLRLGRITGAPHLDERLVFRNSAYEVNYYRERRWTEPPAQCLKRLLARALFETRGLRQVVGGAGPTFDAYLAAFDEIRFPQRVARVQLTARLHDDRVVLWEETLTVDRPVVEQAGGDVAAATVEALGEAMQAVVDNVADRVVRELEKRQ
jgi:ABC-type uncharacterized transport system auxiliary subunit